MRKSDHVNAIRSHEHFDALCASAGLVVTERRYYNVVFKAVVEDLLLRLYEQWRRSLELAPNWYFANINLAALYQSLGQSDSARKYSDRAVESDRFSGLALSFRGEFHLREGEFEAALADFQRSLPVSLERYRNTRGLAAAYAWRTPVWEMCSEASRKRTK